ncbi:hypothetical protein [Methylocystis heyeri]|uniref:hypothetical protein n=1 Tax=Methylocystis heyeri TaxID=391905 RepID=UPI001FE86DDB|nr:hypothetical protein [Methylocystis heyeri]
MNNTLLLPADGASARASRFSPIHRHSRDSCTRSPALQCFDALARTQNFALIRDDPDAPAGAWIIGLPTTFLSIEPVLSKAQGNRKPMTISNRQLTIPDRLDIAGHVPPIDKEFIITIFACSHFHAQTFHFEPILLTKKLNKRCANSHCRRRLWSASIGGDKETCSNPGQTLSIPVVE